MCATPSRMLMAALLAASSSALAGAQTPTSVRPDDGVDRQLLTWLGDGYRLVNTRQFTLICGRTDWPAGFQSRLDSFCDEFIRMLDDAGFEVARPSARLVWVGFDDRGQFDRYVARWERMNLSRLEGYYSTRTNRVATVMPNGQAGAARAPASQPGDETAPLGVSLMHEAAHQLSFNCGLLKRGVMYPLWVTEGLATNFEVGARKRMGENGPRCSRLIDARAGCEITPLAELAVATRVPADRDDARQLYAEAWGLFRFLLDSRAAELKRYLESAARMPEGRRSPEAMKAEFESAFGPIGKLEQSWVRFVAGLDRRPAVADAVPTAVP